MNKIHPPANTPPNRLPPAGHAGDSLLRPKMDQINYGWYALAANHSGQPILMNHENMKHEDRSIRTTSNQFVHPRQKGARRSSGQNEKTNVRPGLRGTQSKTGGPQSIYAALPRGIQGMQHHKPFVEPLFTCQRAIKQSYDGLITDRTGLRPIRPYFK
jgi:hypothetical protein